MTNKKRIAKSKLLTLQSNQRVVYTTRWIFRKVIYQIAGLIILLILFLHSCEKNIDIDIDDIETMLVINSLLEADSTPRVFVSRTRHILDNKELDAVSVAEVVLIDQTGSSYPLDYLGYGVYGTDAHRIRKGETYRIEAEAEGYDAISATAKVPDPVGIVKMDTSSIYGEWGSKEYAVDLVIDDPPGESNYYRLSSHARISARDRQITERYDTLYQSADTVILGYVKDTIDRYFFRYETFWINSEDLAIEEWVQGGALIFSDKLFDGKRYSFNFKLYTYEFYDAADTSAVFIQLESLSEDYYRYLNTREKHYYAKEDPFAVPVVVHNNIENGIGIMGASSVSTDSIPIPPSPYIDDYYYY